MNPGLLRTQEQPDQTRTAPSALYSYPLAPFPATHQPSYDSAPPYAPPPLGSNFNGGGYKNGEQNSTFGEKEYEQHREDIRTGGYGNQPQASEGYGVNHRATESTETVTLEPTRMDNRIV